MRITAISVSGSWPTTSAPQSRPSERVTFTLELPSTTWLFVRISPSSANTNPEPLAAGESDRPRRSGCCFETSMLTTDGATMSTARVTERE